MLTTVERQDMRKLLSDLSMIAKSQKQYDKVSWARFQALVEKAAEEPPPPQKVEVLDGAYRRKLLTEVLQGVLAAEPKEKLSPEAAVTRAIQVTDLTVKELEKLEKQKL